MENLSLRVIFPRLLLRQRLLHSTIIVTAISIARVATIMESVIPAAITDPRTVILVVGEGERLIDATIVVPSCSGEAPVVADGETVFVGEVSVCGGDWVFVIS